MECDPESNENPEAPPKSIQYFFRHELQPSAKFLQNPFITYSDPVGTQRDRQTNRP